MILDDSDTSPPPGRLRRGAPVMCGGALPAADAGSGAAGVPIATSPVSWVLLTVTVGLLALATLWLMRRWSATGIGSSAADGESSAARAPHAGPPPREPAPATADRSDRDRELVPS